MATAVQPQTAPGIKILWIPLALFVSVGGVVGSIYLSAEMGLKACPLCFYQRSFMMAVATILIWGMCLPGIPASALTPLALSSAVAGGGIAVFHTYLDATGFLECPLGITDRLPVPQESLIVFSVLVFLLIVDLFHHRQYLLQGLGAILLGGVLAAICLNEHVTPPPPVPEKPYQTELDGCRRAYREKA